MKFYVHNFLLFILFLEKKGLIVLLGSGVHTVWAFWAVYTQSTWHEVEVLSSIGSWYIGTIIGSAIAAFLIPKWTKKCLYVSPNSLNQSNLIMYLYFNCHLSIVSDFSRMLAPREQFVAHNPDPFGPILLYHCFWTHFGWFS